MVGLQNRTGLALGEDDEGIKHLVELADVENPAVVSQAFVPNSAHLSVLQIRLHDSPVSRVAFPST